MAEEKQHLALPLKYRPMTFDDVVGQEHVVRTLRHAIEANRIANAYLFIGPRGIGKTTLSRIFAKALNCTHPGSGDRNVAAPVEGAQSGSGDRNVAAPVEGAQSGSGDAPVEGAQSGSGDAPVEGAQSGGGDIPVAAVEPCGACDNCREIAAGRSIDVTELDAASHNKVEDVKPIIESVQFKPTASKYKIFIIDECHMLSNAAWNALLKTLEEPPPYVRFIFATTEGDKVLATIISRCQRFDLRRIQTNDIVARLKYICEKEKIAAEEDALLAIARGAEGGMRDALSSLDQLISFKGDKVTEEDALGVFGLVSRSALEGLAGAILKGDVAAILSSIEMFDSAGKNMRRLSGELLQHFRNLVVLQALGPNAKSLEATPDQIKVLIEQAKDLDPGRVFRICDQLAEMEDKLRYVLSVRTLIEMSLIRASRIATTATIEELMKAVKGIRSGEAASSPLQGKDVTSTRSGEDAASPIPAKPVPKWAGGGLPPMPEEPAQSNNPPIQQSNNSPMDRQAMLDDPKLNDILDAIPGATVADIK